MTKKSGVNLNGHFYLSSKHVQMWNLTLYSPIWIYLYKITPPYPNLPQSRITPPYPTCGNIEAAWEEHNK